MMVLMDTSSVRIRPAYETRDCKYRYSKSAGYGKNNLVKKEKRGKF